MKTSLLLLVAASLTLGGCVTKGKYDRAVATTETTRAELQLKDGQLLQRSTELTQRERDIARLKKETNARSFELGKLRTQLANVEAAERAAQQRAIVYRSITQKLQSQIDAGNLSITTRDGRMVLQLPNDILFDTGRTDVKAMAKLTLMAIADVMKSMPGRQFQVAGHTDNVPIHNGQFPSNWELSSGRALNVLHFLVKEGVPGGALSAAGYSEIDPVASNASPEGRKSNRRTEITLQPNIDELVKLPE